MALDYSFEKRKIVIGGAALAVIVVYAVRLFFLQVSSDDYKLRADSNAFRREVQYPSRGLIYDRNGKLLVYNEPSYNILVTMQEQHGIDTLDFCETVGITRDDYIRRMDEIKDARKNPGYSRNTPQLFMAQVSDEVYSQFREKMFRFKGFRGEKRSLRHYSYATAAHILGDVGEVSPADLDSSDYYRPGDYIGKLGVERSYEKQLRGEKGIHIRLRDVRGRDKGAYANGRYDREAQPGRNVTLGLDADLQALAERLLKASWARLSPLSPRRAKCFAWLPHPPTTHA